jgi:hypothetical protein
MIHRLYMIYLTIFNGHYCKEIVKLKNSAMILNKKSRFLGLLFFEKTSFPLIS